MDVAERFIKQWIAHNDDTWTLNLSHLHLTELPIIPSNCKKLNFSGNNLTSLPELPFCQSLNCAGNKLTRLPNLPMCRELNCSRNQIIYLPDLPVCAFLSCYENEYLYLAPKIFKQHDNISRDERATNYPLFATKIQRIYRKYKQKQTSNELQKIYIKNVSGLISLFVY